MKRSSSWSRKTPPANAKKIANDFMMLSTSSSSDFIFPSSIQNQQQQRQQEIRDDTSIGLFPTITSVSSTSSPVPKLTPLGKRKILVNNNDDDDQKSNQQEAKKRKSSNSPFNFRTQERKEHNEKRKQMLALRVKDLEAAHQHEYEVDEEDFQNGGEGQKKTKKSSAIDGRVRPSDVKKLVNGWIEITTAGSKAKSMLEYLQYSQLQKDKVRKEQMDKERKKMEIDKLLATQNEESSKMMVGNLSPIKLLQHIHEHGDTSVDSSSSHADDEALSIATRASSAGTNRIEHQQKKKKKRIISEEEEEYLNSKKPVILSGSGKNFNFFDMPSNNVMIMRDQQQQQNKPPASPVPTKIRATSAGRMQQQESQQQQQYEDSQQQQQPRKKLSSFLTSQKRIIKEQEAAEEKLKRQRNKLLGLA